MSEKEIALMPLAARAKTVVCVTDQRRCDGLSGQGRCLQRCPIPISR